MNESQQNKHPLHHPYGYSIDGYHIDTKKKEIVNCNIIEVEAGTNGYQGGDSAHGCRTVFRLTNRASTDMRLTFHANYSPNGNIEMGDMELRGINGTAGFDLEAEIVEISFGGDSELETFIEALEFAVETLKKQANNGKEKEIPD
jgi:hypothetical protein